MTKPGEKTRRELPAGMEETRKKIRQYEEFGSAVGIPVKLTGIFKFLWNHGVPWRGGLRQTP